MRRVECTSSFHLEGWFGATKEFSPPLFIQVVMYVRVRGIHFASFYDFEI
jgi:hypothetical protein